MSMTTTGATGRSMIHEVGEQPGVWSALSLSPQIERLAEAIRDRAPRALLTVARGSSEHAALYGRFVARVRSGLPTGSLSPFALTGWEAPGPGADALVIAVSQSGASPDLVESVERSSASGAMTIAITNHPDSALASVSDHILPLGAGVELAVAATKTYSASVAAFRLLIGAVAGEDASDRSQLAEAWQWRFDSVRASTEHRLPELVSALADAHDVHIVARGPELATAREAALKLTETCSFIAQGWSAADILHGPIAGLSERSVVLGLDCGRGATSVREALAAAEHRGATVIPLGLPEETPGLGELDAPIVSVTTFQLLAHAVSLSRGMDPDRPVGLSKVTQTR